MTIYDDFLNKLSNSRPVFSTGKTPNPGFSGLKMQPGYRNQFIRQQRAKGHLQLHYMRILQLCHDYCYHNITTFKRQMLSHWLTLLQNLHDWLALLPKWVLAYTHTHPFNSPLSGTTRVSRYHRGKTNLDFTEARDSEWQWHQLGHMQVCTSL